MANVFDEIITKGIRAGQVPARTEEARKWYREMASKQGRINERKLISSDKDRTTNTIKPGSMYMYLYDPKHKATLPYYDRAPLVFPFKVEGGKFWGINLHYLPLELRAKLMDALYETRINSRYDESTRLRISYQLLNSASKYKYFEPCVKQYLINHVQSEFMYVYPSEWDVALWLPTERFVKATKTQVWSDSRKKVTSN
jgi:hypothetical protein